MAEPPITVRFPKEVADAVRDRAASDGIAVNGVIVEACRIYTDTPKQPSLEDRVGKLEYDMQEVRAIVLRDDG